MLSTRLKSPTISNVEFDGHQAIARQVHRLDCDVEASNLNHISNRAFIIAYLRKSPRERMEKYQSIRRGGKTMDFRPNGFEMPTTISSLLHPN